MNQRERNADQIRQVLDFGKTANDYVEHRKEFPNGLYERLFAAGFLVPGMKALDLGTGAGAIARGLYRRGVNVIGLDPAMQLLEQAKRIDRSLGLEIDYYEGIAEYIPFADNDFDAVIAGQSWHWFDSLVAIEQVRRVLKPRGRIIICHFDWLPIGQNIVRKTEELMEAANPDWNYGSGCGIYTQWLEDLQIGGFEQIETFSFDVIEHYSKLAWRGRVRASGAIQGSLSKEHVEEFDHKLSEMLKDFSDESDLTIPHRVWAVTALKAER